jgi:hypothetical protein
MERSTPGKRIAGLGMIKTWATIGDGSVQKHYGSPNSVLHARAKGGDQAPDEPRADCPLFLALSYLTRKSACMVVRPLSPIAFLSVHQADPA